MYVVTNKGLVVSKFECGLEQGNPELPFISLLTIKLKNNVWKLGIKEEIEYPRTNTSEAAVYTFNTTDKEDGIVKVRRTGYCNENTRFIKNIDENIVLIKTKIIYTTSARKTYTNWNLSKLLHGAL